MQRNEMERIRNFNCCFVKLAYIKCQASKRNFDITVNLKEVEIHLHSICSYFL